MLSRSVMGPLLVVLIATGLAVPTGAAQADPTGRDDGATNLEGITSATPNADPPISTTPVVVPMAFPVVGAVSYTDTFLACRGTGCSRRHLGQDIMGTKMLPLIAAFSGTVSYIQRETTVGAGNSVSIRSTDGVWSVNYIHVNNDTPGTDDGRGTANHAFLPGLQRGNKVARGQLIGWMGDSGNAEATSAHLHFELRKGEAWSGTAYNAYPSLRAGLRLTAALTAAPHQPGELVAWAGGPPFLLTSDGGRRAVPPSLMPLYGWTADDVVTVTGGEVMMYPYLGIAPLREGSVVLAPNGTRWAMTGGRRYLVTAGEVTLMGLSAAGVIPVTDEVLLGTPLGIGPVPGGVYRNGALLRELGSPQVWMIGSGLRRPIHQGTWPWWRISAAQVATVPVGALSLPGAPALGAVIAYKNGAIYRTTTQGTFMLVAGIRRQIKDPRAQTYYNWSSKEQFWLYESVSAILPLGSPIA